MSSTLADVYAVDANRELYQLSPRVDDQVGERQTTLGRGTGAVVPIDCARF